MVLTLDNSKRGIDLAKPVDGFVRLFHPTSHGATGGKCANRRHAARGRTHRPFSPRARFVISPTEEMRQCGSGEHIVYERIEWTESHGVGQMLYRQVHLAKKDLRPTAEAPRGSIVRIEKQRSIDEGRAFFHLAVDVGERDPAPTKRDRIILP